GVHAQRDVGVVAVALHERAGLVFGIEILHTAGLYYAGARPAKGRVSEVITAPGGRVRAGSSRIRRLLPGQGPGQAATAPRDAGNVPAVISSGVYAVEVNLQP